MKLLITFIVLSIINVVFSTVRSITTIKSGKTVASLISGGYFSFYNIMLIYTVADFPMWEKCVITFVCNVIGVYIVKLIEERMRKDKLWKVELTIEEANTEKLETHLTELDIPHNYIITEKYSIFNAYCQTQKESALVKELGNRYNAKFFVTETKTL
jgi:uncharacterized protein YebE (UPF0316 family)